MSAAEPGGRSRAPQKNHSLRLDKKLRGAGKRDIKWCGAAKRQSAQPCSSSPCCWPPPGPPTSPSLSRLTGRNVRLRAAPAQTDSHFAGTFSLFSIVQFPNQQCSAASSTSSSTTYGVCYTSSECTGKGGAADGNCAAGFGVCCE